MDENETNELKRVMRMVQGETLKHIRDRMILALLFCGVPVSKIVDMMVGDRVPVDAESFVREWLQVSGIQDGHLVRAINKGGGVGSKMTQQAVYKMLWQIND
ncbi:MAG: hypothetical protein HPY45_01835 [Anaerolineae bacterium]|nr:hypothetical protein [Anaerolineae bacterium]